MLPGEEDWCFQLPSRRVEESHPEHRNRMEEPGLLRVREMRCGITRKATMPLHWMAF